MDWQRAGFHKVRGPASDKKRNSFFFKLKSHLEQHSAATSSAFAGLSIFKTSRTLKRSDSALMNMYHFEIIRELIFYRNGRAWRAGKQAGSAPWTSKVIAMVEKRFARH